MPRRLSSALLVLVALAGGCRSREQPGELSRERFVRVNVALRLLPDSAADREARRAAILRREHVTAAQLQAWVRHRDAATLAEVWRVIAARVDSAQVRAPRRPPHGPPGAAPAPPATGGPQQPVIRAGVRPPDPRRLPGGRIKPAADSVRKPVP